MKIPRSNPSNNLLSSIELKALRLLKDRRSLSKDRPTYEIAELCEALSIRDDDDVLRALYNLEGKDLVKPRPEGDLTSHHWEITEIGIRALQMLEA